MHEDRRPPDVGRIFLWAERVAWSAGIVALSVSIAANVSGFLAARHALEVFATGQAAGAVGMPDHRLWSAERIQAWEDTLKRDSPAPLAVLRIPKIALEVPVLDGTDEWTLNRAVGRIEDTAMPGTTGNAGIAGHRDGFFRGLKDIRAGDRIEIETRAGIEQYEVERTWIVDPVDVSVLDPTPSPSITLVTCYPFYFVGPAPQRFIVRAVRTNATKQVKDN